MKNIAAVVLFALTTLPLMAQTQFLKPEGLASTNGAFSQVVVTTPGKIVFIAGQVAFDREGKLVGKGDLKAQATQAFENLNTAVTAAGGTMDDVVKINWYIKNYTPEYLPMLREVRTNYVNKNSPPASTLIGVQSLFMEDVLIEIEAIAVVSDKAAPKKSKK